MKKKYLLLILFAFLALDLQACSHKQEDMNTVQNVNTDEEENEEKKEDEKNLDLPEDEKTDVSQEEIADEKEIISDLKIRVYKDYYNDEVNTQYITGYCPVVEFEGEGYPELRDGIDSWFANFRENYEKNVEDYIVDAKMMSEDMGDDFYPYYFENTASIVRKDENVTSFAIEEISYTGGAHGYAYRYGVNFDSKTGKEIQFSDLGDIRDEVKAYVDEQIQNKRKNGHMLELYEDAMDDFLNEPAWYLDGAGLSFVFNAYVIGSYAEGRTIVTIPYDEMKSFNNDYKMTSNAMFYELDTENSVAIDLNDDGEKEILALSMDYSDSYDTQVKLKVNDLTLDVGSCSYMTNAYLTKCENGRIFVIISCDMMSDDYGAFLVEITDGVLKPCETFEYGGVVGISNESVEMEGNIYTLGTYGGRREYSFSEGTFVPIDDRFVFHNSKNDEFRRGPVLKNRIKVKMLVDGEMVEQELDAGTTIYPVNSDVDHVVGFELEDGSYGEVEIERKDATIYINGILEWDLFDDLPYAG